MTDEERKKTKHDIRNLLSPLYLELSDDIEADPGGIYRVELEEPREHFKRLKQALALLEKL